MAGLKNSNLNGALLYLRILSTLSSNEYKTANQIYERILADGVEIEKRALQRALQTLVADVNGLVECNSTAKPYGYRRSALLTFDGLNETDLLLLRLARESLAFQMPQELARKSRRLFNDADCATHTDRASEAWLDKIAVTGDTLRRLPPAVDEVALRTVALSLEGNLVLDLRYRGLDGQPIVGPFLPYGFVKQVSRFYLVGRFDAESTLRKLPLDRIESMTLTKQVFVYPETFDLKTLIENEGIDFGNGRKVRLRLAVNRRLGLELESSPLSNDQEMRWDGEVAYITATRYETPRIMAWIRSQGSDILEHNGPGFEPYDDFQPALFDESL